jgi:type I restriction enzyme M protein
MHKPTARRHRHPHAPLGDLAEVFPGLAVARKKTDDGIDTPIIGVSDLDGAGSVAGVEDLERAPLPLGRSTDGYRVRVGDVLITARGTQLKVAVVDAATEGAVLSANLLCIRPREDRLLPGALAAWLLTAEGHAALTGRYHSTTGLLALTTTVVRRLPVPVPPLAVQSRASALFDATRTGYIAAMRAADARQALGLAAITSIFTSEDRP